MKTKINLDCVVNLKTWSIWLDCNTVIFSKDKIEKDIYDALVFMAVIK